MEINLLPFEKTLLLRPNWVKSNKLIILPSLFNNSLLDLSQNMEKLPKLKLRKIKKDYVQKGINSLIGWLKQNQMKIVAINKLINSNI